ncbi:hypothetical protein EYZ11_003994 [Aspergillus tanneri]|uniref:Uncharacterized protein n=1 Tax=Aspergillus tanneri TaxID=1220188 RepID=A0A4S3JMA9_9EURO|nr:hypothetical protein EYZ11_003994 [Aspergillus tanneri]
MSNDTYQSIPKIDENDRESHASSSTYGHIRNNHQETSSVDLQDCSSLASLPMSIPNTSMGTTWCGEIPVELETRKFHTRVDEGGITDFVGGWNDETNAAWDTILDGILPLPHLLLLNIQLTDYRGID